MTAIPVHPQPSFYETTVAVVDHDGVEGLIDHRVIDAIRDRPKWTFADAELRLMQEHFRGRPPRRGKRRMTKAERAEQAKADQAGAVGKTDPEA